MIRFSCPYCTAPIEVDDPAAGKTGRCPKCASRLLVPRPAGMAAPAPQTPPPSSVELPVYTPPPEVTGAISTEFPSFPATVAAPPTVTRRLRKKKSTHPMVWVVPILGVLVLAGVGLWLTQPSLFKLALSRTELIAEAVPTHAREAVIIPCQNTPLAARQLTGVLEGLAKEPVHLSGQLMRAQIGARLPESLTVSIQPGERTIWYRVRVPAGTGLAEELARHASLGETSRKAVLDKARNEFLAAMVRVQAEQESLSDLARYRDNLVLPAVVDGIGYSLMAKVGRDLYRCMGEDKDGSLYFLLPPQVTRFALQARALPDGSLAFDGEYAVTVQQEALDSAPVEVERAPAAEPSPSSDTPEKTESEPEMTPEPE